MFFIGVDWILLEIRQVTQRKNPGTDRCRLRGRPPCCSGAPRLSFHNTGSAQTAVCR